MTTSDDDVGWLATRCEPLGQTVGYQIRLEAKRSAATRLLFCTTGVLLRRLHGDAMLEGISHVVVDEVAEWRLRVPLSALECPL